VAARTSPKKPNQVEVFETERARLNTRIAELEDELAAVIGEADARSAADTDSSDAGSGDVERDRVTALLAVAHDGLAQLDAASRRAESGTWGLCATCGKKISAERLAAVPTATSCVTCARPGVRRGMSRR